MEQSNNTIRHLLVVRIAAMGDVAMLPHAIRALKEAYPELKITIATQKLFEPFFESLDVDFLFIDPHKGDYISYKGINALSKQIKQIGVDAVADLHFAPRAFVFSTFLRLRGIKVAHLNTGRVEKWFRFGYSPDNAVPLKHTVIRYCDVFRRLGFTFEDPSTTAPIFASRPNNMGIKVGKWIGVAPFSGFKGKTYPEPLRSSLIELLSTNFDRVFIHSGGGEEAEYSHRMERKYANVTALNGRVGLKEEIDLIANLDCVISMDSLVMHLCSLTRTPVVTVWGATHPELGFLGYGADESGVLQEQMSCRPCSTYGNKPCKYGDFRCIYAITPQKIVDKVKQLAK